LNGAQDLNQKISGVYHFNPADNTDMIIDSLLIRRRASIKRHIAKTITWRIVATLDTILLSWLVTGNSSFALKIGGLEVCTKMVFYFLHERLWFRLNFGLPHREEKP